MSVGGIVSLQCLAQRNTEVFVLCVSALISLRICLGTCHSSQGLIPS